MSSLGGRALENILQIIRGVYALQNVEDIGRLIVNYGWDRPLLDLYMSTGCPVPVLTSFSSVYVPIARMYLPVPDHSVIVFVRLPTSKRTLASVLEQFVNNPSLASLIMNQLPFKRYLDNVVPISEKTIRELDMEEPSTLSEFSTILRRIGLRPITVEWIEELLPYLPPEIVDYISEKIHNWFYDYRLFRRLEDIYNMLPREEKRRLVRFLQSYPFLYYPTLKIYTPEHYARIKEPGHLRLTSYGDIVTLNYDKEENRFRARIDGYRLCRPEWEHGLLLDYLPPSETGEWIVYDYERPSRARLCETITFPNPLTGEELKLREIKWADIRRFFLY